MADSNHDDAADALARLARGDVAPSEHLQAENAAAEPTHTSPIPPIKKTVRPANARPAVPTPPAPTPVAAPALGAAQRPVRPAAPVLGHSAGPASTPPPAPPTSGFNRTIAPKTVAPAQARRSRPVAPTLGSTTLATGETEIDGGQSTGLCNTAQNAGQNGQVVDDDDSVIMPAPDASVFIRKKKNAGSAEARAAIAKKKSLEYRRTLIPILLTCGTLLLGFGVLKFTASGDSTLQYFPSWISIALLGAGVLLLALAGVNMMSVKQQLLAAKSGL